MTDFTDYQIATRETAIYPDAQSGTYDALSYVTLGLVSEAGEIAGKLKKIYRDNAGVITPEKLDAITAELGDVLWYVARLADESGVALADIAHFNLEKLNSRKARGVIGGSGDNR